MLCPLCASIISAEIDCGECLYQNLEMQTKEICRENKIHRVLFENMSQILSSFCADIIISEIECDELEVQSKDIKRE
jgi:hypothetical protein